jgi:hypothetical protein
MSQYARIKQQTNIATSWLVETARQHGAHANPPATATGRLKGKARKEAKGAQQEAMVTNASNASNDPSNGPRAPTVVGTQDILRYANHLAGVEKGFEMPGYVQRAFQCAIQGRQKYADRFAKEHPEDPGNAPHSYFIGVLTRVLELIARRVKASAGDAHSSIHGRSNDPRGIPLSNAFAMLTVQDTAEMDIGCDLNDTEESMTSADQGDAFTTVPARYEPEILPADEIDLFRNCYRDEIEELLQAAKSVWIRHFAGGQDAPDLATATILTDAACAMVHSYHSEIARRAGSGAIVRYDADHFTLRTAATLEAFRDVGEGDSVYPQPVVKLEHRLDRVPEVLYNDQEAYHQWDQEDSFLIQYLTDLDFYVVGKHSSLRT